MIKHVHLNRGPAKSFWNPEFAAYMVEGTPGIPYGSDGHLISSLCEVEGNMRFRRLEVMKILDRDETVMSITSFPRLGCPGFTYPTFHPNPETSASGSLFFPDEAIFGGHPRFKTLVKNIRARRRRKVIINLPIFKDTFTRDPFVENFNDEEARKAVKPNHVYMDAMGFGMGCCCLQITFQATHLEEAKVLYDQLATITPIALALSAASPVYRGCLTDRDCRWNVISASVDDRTREESSETRELKESLHRIQKSRYDSISVYLSRQGQKYNDIPLVFDQNYFDVMVANKVDPAVARHIAHLFIREPITLYKEKLNQTDEELDHFENIQSTNWQTMRFKPPPSVNSSIGWRVEFRPLEAQTTDYENAAYVVFITLLTRVILACKLNFLIPLSLVDENMVEAQKRDAVKNSEFWFRKDIMHKSSSKEPLNTVLENAVCGNSESQMNQQSYRPFPAHDNISHLAFASKTSPESSAAKMTIDEIINGSAKFVGIMPIIHHYVESMADGSNTEQISKIFAYLKLISDRASSKTKTTARMMRDFIDAHPKYRHDSIVGDDVAYDLLQMMDKIGKGEIIEPELTGDLTQAPIQANVNRRNLLCCDPAMSSFHSVNNNNSTNLNHGNCAIVKKSSTLCNGFNSTSRKSPSGRVAKQSAEKTTNHCGSSNRSMSR